MSRNKIVVALVSVAMIFILSYILKEKQEDCEVIEKFNDLALEQRKCSCTRKHLLKDHRGGKKRGKKNRCNILLLTSQAKDQPYQAYFFLF